MTTDNEKSPSSSTEDGVGAVEPDGPELDDVVDDTEPPHPFGDTLRAFGDKAGDVAGEARTVAVDRAKVVGRKLADVAESGVTAARRVPGKAWVAVGAGVALGLGLLARGRRRRRSRD